MMLIIDTALAVRSINIKDTLDKLEIEPEQARWNVSPMFYKLLDKKGIIFEGNLEEILLEMLETAEQNSSGRDFAEEFLNLFIVLIDEIK